MTKLHYSYIFCAICLFTASAFYLEQSLDSKPSPTRGKIFYTQFACANCHGKFGQGVNLTDGGGPSLLPNLVSPATFMRQLRNPRLNMPIYSENLISDHQITDIYAHLNALKNGAQ